MKKISSINQIINDARQGKMFILVDNKDRENEGDLVIPASKVNPKKIRQKSTKKKHEFTVSLSDDCIAGK